MPSVTSHSTGRVLTYFDLVEGLEWNEVMRVRSFVSNIQRVCVR